MRRTNWSPDVTFGGEPLTSRYTQQRVAASDHCVAIVRRCERCHETFVATPKRPKCSCQWLSTEDARELADGWELPETKHG